MTRRSAILSVLILCLLFTAARTGVRAGAEKDAGPYVYIDKTELTLLPGNYGWLNSHLENKKPGMLVTAVRWESTDPEVVTIGSDGQYLARARCPR